MELASADWIYICKELEQTSFEPHGNELLYSGLTGEQLETSVFIGPALLPKA